MRHPRVRRVLAVVTFLLLAAAPAYAQSPGALARVDSARTGATIPVFLHAAPGAYATLILLPGGAGGIGKTPAEGWPEGGNFLVRSAPMFAAAGYNLAIMARPSDMEDMDYGFRTSRAHVDDVRRVAQIAKQKFGVPVWLVGTSRGSVSAAVAMIEMRDEALVEGIVLTSSVTNLRKRAGAVPTLSLDRIRVPVLVMHHEKDACENCRPEEARLIVRGLTNAPVKKLVMVNGGSGAHGNPCEAFHYHGYIGMEQEAVNVVTAWIRNPAQ